MNVFKTKARYVDLNNPKYASLPIQQQSDQQALFAMVADSVRSNTVETWFSLEEFWSLSRMMVVENPFSPWDSEAQTPHKTLKVLTTSLVEEIPVRYNSVTPHGEKVTVSGKIFLPKFPPIKGIIIASHYTIGSSREAPSESFSFEGIFATKGYIVLMSDYLGYGLSSQYIHPYLDVTNTAQVTVDLLKAALPYLHYRKFIPNTSELILLGYSQGGAATIGIAQLIEQSYPQFHIKHIYVGAGPYNPAATYDFCVKANQTQVPCAVPMIILGMSYSKQLNLQPHDYFRNPLLKFYRRWILSKVYSFAELNRLMQDIPLSDLLTPLAFDKKAHPTDLLYEALKTNDVTHYVPKAPVYFFHSIDDDMVPFVNSQLIHDALIKKGTEATYDFGHYGSHMNAAIDFFQKIYAHFL